jgi:short-subunit dehydrogenase
MNQPVLVLGATSSIARSLAMELAQRGHGLILASRDQRELAAIAQDLRVRYNVVVTTRRFDALDFASHAAFFKDVCAACPEGLHAIALVHGYMPDDDAPNPTFDEARKTIDTNFTSCVSILEPAAEYFAARRLGAIVAVSSVAADRATGANYIYSASKSALSTYLTGLRKRLHRAGVCVLTVKPGSVDTAMTFGRTRVTAGLVAQPAEVARAIATALGRRRSIVYTPWFWWPISILRRSIPEFIDKRLNG